MKIYPIAVIGGGSSGTMAVLRCVLNNDETLFFPGNRSHLKRSRAFWVSKIENMPGHFNYKRAITEPNQETYLWLKQSCFANKFHWNKNIGIKKIIKKSNIFELIDDNGKSYLVEYIILCTGIMDVQPCINDSIKPILPYANVQLADYCIRCDGHHTYKKDTAVIGYTDQAAWVAIMLYERYKNPSMSILLNGEKSEFKEETKRLLNKYCISVFNKKITDISGDAKANVLKSLIFADSSYLNLQIVFISLGVIVYNNLALDLNAKLDNGGFVITDQKGESSINNLFIAGDLRAGTKKQVYTAWDSAVDAADAINARIRKKIRTI